MSQLREFYIKVAISEFGLSMLMFILLNHYIFIKGMMYLHDRPNICGLKANKCIFNYIVLHCLVCMT